MELMRHTCGHLARQARAPGVGQGGTQTVQLLFGGTPLADNRTHGESGDNDHADTQLKQKKGIVQDLACERALPTCSIDKRNAGEQRGSQCRAVAPITIRDPDEHRHDREH